jgi:lysophospholipase L1-like esterase
VSQDHGFAVSLGVKIGCAREGGPDCPPPWDAQIARLRPDVVLLAETGVWSLWPLRVGSRVVPIGTPAWDEAWIAQHQEVVNELIAAGARRLAITTLPCIRAWMPRLGAQNMARASANLSTLAARNPEHVQLIDLAAYVCPEGEYRWIPGSDPLRFDGVHYSPEGSDLVARWLAPQLVRAARAAAAP